MVTTGKSVTSAKANVMPGTEKAHIWIAGRSFYFYYAIKVFYGILSVMTDTSQYLHHSWGAVVAFAPVVTGVILIVIGGCFSEEVKMPLPSNGK